MKHLLIAALALTTAVASAQWRGSDDRRENDNRYNQGRYRDRDRDGINDRVERRRISARIDFLQDQIRRVRADRRLNRWEKERRIDHLQDEINRLRRDRRY